MINHNLTRSFLFVICFFLTGTIVSGQVAIFSNPITGTNPNASNPYTTGQSTDPNLTVSGIGRSSGIAGENSNDRYNASGWTTANAIDINDYFEFTLTANSTYNIDFTSFVYTGQASGSGPSGFAFRSSLDNYATNIGTATAGGGTISLSGAAYQNITGPITFRFYAWNSNNAGGTYSINSFTFNAATALPIVLQSVDVKILGSSTLLSFSTATETNNSHFVIERSGDARTFSEIGQVRGAGTTQEPHDYTFTDEKPLNGTNYYRLRQVDYDGTESFSHVVSVVFGKPDRITIAPSPATDRVNISLEEALNAAGQWQVFDNMGRQILSGTWEAESADYELDVNILPEGMYTFRLTVGSEVQVKQFRKL